MFAVKLGNHRSVAILILTKKMRILPTVEIGKIDGKVLTAGELVKLFERRQLTTLNSNFRGIGWVDESKIEDIVNNFKIEKLFDKSRDGGVGVELQTGGRINFKDVKIDFGHGELLTDYLKNRWAITI